MDRAWVVFVVAVGCAAARVCDGAAASESDPARAVTWRLLLVPASWSASASDDSDEFEMVGFFASRHHAVWTPLAHWQAALVYRASTNILVASI
jgi:hypothetical protein